MTFQRTYIRHVSNIDKELKDLETYYEERKPFFDAKIERVQRENQERLEARLKVRSDKLTQTLRKIEIMSEKEIETRKRYNDELDNKQEHIDANRHKRWEDYKT